MDKMRMSSEDTNRVPNVWNIGQSPAVRPTSLGCAGTETLRDGSDLPAIAHGRTL